MRALARTATASVAPLSYGFYRQRPGREGLQEFCLGFREMDPCRPVLWVQHHNLAIVDGRYVRPGFGRQHRKGGRMIALALTPKACDRHKWRTLQREPVLGLWIFLAGEFEERRCRYKTAVAVGEASPLRPEVEYRPAFARGRKAEIHLNQFDQIAGRAHDRPHVVDLDVVRLRQVEFCLLRRDAEFQVLHHLAVFGPADVLLVVVAHDLQLSDFSSFFEGSIVRPSGGAGLSAS